jgi:hypothetical protein
VIDLLEQDFMTIKCGLQFALILLLLNRHPEDVCGTLQKSDVVFAKLTFGFAVHFQYTEWRAVALENDIHRTANAVLNQQVRCPKALLIFEVVRNNRLAGAQRVAGGGRQIGSDAGHADDTLAPADSGSNQKAVLSWSQVCEKIDRAIFITYPLSRLERRAMASYTQWEIALGPAAKVGKVQIFASARESVVPRSK